jgi:cell division protein FtsA
LSEYATGLNARIGYPNEHLAAGHIDELAKPMYATCIGLIVKGYNVYENSQTRTWATDKTEHIMADETEEENTEVVESGNGTVGIKIKGRGKTLKGFMDSIKDGLIDLFKEEEDSHL